MLWAGLHFQGKGEWIVIMNKTIANATKNAAIAAALLNEK